MEEQNKKYTKKKKKNLKQLFTLLLQIHIL